MASEIAPGARAGWRRRERERGLADAPVFFAHHALAPPLATPSRPPADALSPARRPPRSSRASSSTRSVPTIALAVAGALALAAAAVVAALRAPAGPVVPAAVLAAATGADGGRLWVAFLGDVFDVGATERGRRLYGPGGDYAFFAGRDGTAAFLTGVADDAAAALPPGALADPDAVASLAHWLSFYAASPYPRVGVTPGPWYDGVGRKTGARVEVERAVARAGGTGGGDPRGGES